MPSTGTAKFTITCDGMINASLRTLRVLQEGQFANPTQINTGREALNTLIKFWQSNGLQLWTYDLIFFQTQPNKNAYTIGAVGADINAIRPLRILDPCLSRLTQGSQTFDTPLTILSRADFLMLGNKTALGYVNSIYYDANIVAPGGGTSPSVGLATIVLYVQPVDASRTIILNVQRPLYDMDSNTDEFDFPAEWFLALRYGLAEFLADEYEVPEDRLTRISAQALKYKNSVQDWSVEAAPTRFKADMQAYRKFRRR